MVLFAILVIYVLLGCVMDSLAMILLTDPDLLPDGHGPGPLRHERPDKAIWFGILALMVVEIGLVTRRSA